MSTIKKCAECKVDISAGEKCVFAVYKRVVNGKDHYFCCVRHADEFEKKQNKIVNQKKKK